LYTSATVLYEKKDVQGKRKRWMAKGEVKKNTRKEKKEKISAQAEIRTLRPKRKADKKGTTLKVDGGMNLIQRHKKQKTKGGEEVD